jgi:glutamyl-tRNA reductase
VSLAFEMPRPPRELLVAGISHRTAGVGLRALAALDSPARAALAADLVGRGCVAEAMVVSTCNRVEVYAAGGAEEGDAGRAALALALARHTRLPGAVLRGCMYELRGEAAARHLFRVASSLESMNVGEPEIQGQIRAALAEALAAGTAGPFLGAAVRAALVCGKRVRRLTDIGRGAVSITSLVAGVAREALGDLGQRRVTIVGAGHMAAKAGVALAAQRPRELVVVNRGSGPARELADRLEARAEPLAELPRRVACSDLVVCCTGAPGALLDRAAVARAVAGRAGPLVLIDLAVPPDLAPGVEAVPGAVVHRLDGLLAMAQRNRAGRRAGATRAEAIVAEQLARHLARAADGGRARAAA